MITLHNPFMKTIEEMGQSLLRESTMGFNRISAMHNLAFVHHTAKAANLARSEIFIRKLKENILKELPLTTPNLFTLLRPEKLQLCSSYDEREERMSSRDVERGRKHRGETQWTAWLTPTIVLANVAVFIVVMFINDCPKTINGANGDCIAKFLRRFSFQPLRENPLLGPSSSTLDKMGALVWSKVVHGNEKWRLITSMWLHAGIFHLLTNMFNVIVFGIRLEQQFGFIRIGLIYLISGFGGSVLSALFLQNSISVGASGALLGLMGAMLSELLINWTIYASKLGALFTILFIIAINLGIGLLPWVDNFAHIGGFLTGFLLGFVLLIRPQFGWEEYRNSSQYGAPARSKYNPCQYVLFFIAAVLVVAGLTVGTVMLFKGENGNKHCKWCHRLDCYPTSKWSC